MKKWLRERKKKSLTPACAGLVVCVQYCKCILIFFLKKKGYVIQVDGMEVNIFCEILY